MKLALAVIMAVALAGAAVAQEAKNDPCPAAVKQDVEELAKRFVRLGAKGTIVGATCNVRGNLSVLTIHRKSDDKTTRWKPKDGLAALIDRVMAWQ